MGATLSSAWILPRHKRNDWLPARADIEIQRIQREADWEGSVISYEVTSTDPHNVSNKTGEGERKHKKILAKQHFVWNHVTVQQNMRHTATDKQGKWTHKIANHVLH